MYNHLIDLKKLSIDTFQVLKILLNTFVTFTTSATIKYSYSIFQEAFSSMG